MLFVYIFHFFVIISMSYDVLSSFLLFLGSLVFWMRFYTLKAAESWQALQASVHKGSCFMDCLSWKVKPKFFKIVVYNYNPNPDHTYSFMVYYYLFWANVRTLATNRRGWKENVNALCALWHLSKLLFSCFFKFKGYSGSGKNNSNYRDRAASSD